jgi:hypothetical protein
MPLNEDPGALSDSEYEAKVAELAGGPCAIVPADEVAAALIRLAAAEAHHG